MAMKLLTTVELDSDSAASFTSSIDSIYKLYIFSWQARLTTDERGFMFNVSTDGGSNYNVRKDTTFFNAFHAEDDSGTPNVAYDADYDGANITTTAQDLNRNFGNDADQNGVGIVKLFNPSNTTYVKHFTSESQNYAANNVSYHVFMGGYANTTSAINAVQFSCSSGVAVGFVKMYGVG